MTQNNQDRELAQLLGDLSGFICRYVSLSSAQADACALWTIHTHALDAADFTPYLDINSPVLRSGKTRLLEVLRLLAHNPWFTGRLTGSALARKVDKDHPTLLFDESDAVFQTRGDHGEALRGILNAGFERDGTCSMSVQKGNDWEPRDFSTFSPKAIAGIGNLPATIRDRSIPVRLKRAQRVSKLQRFRKRLVRPEGEQLRQKIEAWAKVNTFKLRETNPEMPDELNDRQQDVCEPLLAIADLAGGVWPARARVALVELCTGFAQLDDCAGLRLLADIREVFAQLQRDRISTFQLLDNLQQYQESPWSEFDHGRPLTGFQLAKLLRPFDVRPRDIRFDQTVQKGYTRADFDDSWNRYLAPPSVEHGPERQQGQQASIHAGWEDFREGQQDKPVAAVKNAESPINMSVVADVALLSPKWEELGGATNPRTETNKNGLNHCRVHPRNKTEWWLRGGVDPVCSICHPNPA